MICIAILLHIDTNIKNTNKMNKFNEYIKSYIEEIISTKDSECVIDKDGMDSFAKRNNIIDGFRIDGIVDNILDKHIETFNSILERNKSNKCNEIIFSLYHSEITEIDISIVDRIIEVLQAIGDIDIMWETSKKKDLKPEELDMIVLIGFE